MTDKEQALTQNENQKTGETIDLAQIGQLIDVAQRRLLEAKQLIQRYTISDLLPKESAQSERIIEGIFDGQAMISKNGDLYPVPQNYASKSKLVEGDLLKMTIADSGQIFFKQIGPIERQSAIGHVIEDDGRYLVMVRGRAYNILKASVTFWQVEPGDKLAVLIPAGSYQATFAAVDYKVESAD